MIKNVKIASIVLALAFAGGVSQSASAAIISFSNQALWTYYTQSNGVPTWTETFDSYNGYYAGSVTGVSGPVTWIASATQGLFVASGLFSTNNPETLSFTFSAGNQSIQGVGGNIFATDTTFNTASAIMQVTLADGTSHIGFSTSITDFVGFYSTGAAITGLTITATPLPNGSLVYPTVNNLSFATIPAPGAVALLGIVGLLSRRRR